MELGNACLPRENHVYRSVERGVIQCKFGDPSVELTGKKLRGKYEKLNSIWLKKRRFLTLTGYAHLYIFHLVPRFNELRIHMLQISMVIFVERFCKDLKYKQWSLIMRCWFNNHVEMLKEGAKIRKKLSVKRLINLT